MNFVALRMLTGDRAKYFGLVFAIAFSALSPCTSQSAAGGLLMGTTSTPRESMAGPRTGGSK